MLQDPRRDNTKSAKTDKKTGRKAPTKEAKQAQDPKKGETKEKETSPKQDRKAPT